VIYDFNSEDGALKESDAHRTNQNNFAYGGVARTRLTWSRYSTNQGTNVLDGFRCKLDLYVEWVVRSKRT